MTRPRLAAACRRSNGDRERPSLVMLLFEVGEWRHAIVLLEPHAKRRLGASGIVLGGRLPRDAQGGAIAKLPDHTTAPMGHVPPVSETQTTLHTLSEQRAHTRPASAS